MNRLVARANRGFTLVESLIVMVLLGVLAAIAIPNFIRFRDNSKRSEAKANLGMWYSLERAYLQEKATYTESVLSVGFLPEPGNRYAYYFGRTQNCANTPQGNCVPADVNAHPDLEPTPPAYLPRLVIWPGPGTDPRLPGMAIRGGHISGFAASNIDGEANGIDTWWISTKSVSEFEPFCGAHQSAIAVGTPVLSYDDVTCD